MFWIVRFILNILIYLLAFKVNFSILTPSLYMVENEQFHFYFHLGGRSRKEQITSPSSPNYKTERSSYGKTTKKQKRPRTSS